MMPAAHRIIGALVAAAMSTALPALAMDAETAQRCAEAEKRLGTIDAPAEAKPGTVTVLLYKYRFCKPETTVKAGTTVRFLNVDKRTSHSVWFKEAGQAESERFFPEEFVEMTFDTPGTYPFLCGPHWEQENMRGVLTVVP